MTNPSIPIPEAAIDAGVRWLMETPDIGTQGAGVVEGILRAAAPHLLEEAHSAIEHLHNDVGTLTDQLNRARDVLRSLTEACEAYHRDTGHEDPHAAMYGCCDWICEVMRSAREALRALEAPK